MPSRRHDLHPATPTKGVVGLPARDLRVVAFLLLTGCPDYRLHPDDKPPVGDTGPDVPWVVPEDLPLVELCNGIDDDGDGAVDEDYPDVDGDGTADCLDDSCVITLPDPIHEDGGACISEPVLGDPPANPWDFVREWVWTEGDPAWGGGAMTNTPAVGDLDGDGQPEAVVVYFQTDTSFCELAVIDGTTGTARWSSPYDITHQFDCLASVAIGDIDGDGDGEIVAYAMEGNWRFLVAVDHEGEPLWEHRTMLPSYGHAPAITDLDGDGTTEVLSHWEVLNGATGEQNAELDIPRDPDYEWANIPVPMEVNGDGTQEVLLRNGVYDHSGSLLFECGETGVFVFSLPVDADDDEEGEVLVYGEKSLTLCDDDGTELWTRSLPDTTHARPMAAADFDLDGRQEFAVPIGGAVRLIDDDGRDLWSAQAKDDSSAAGLMTWDIDLDGIPEVLYGDEDAFHVYNGASGDEEIAFPEYGSVTAMETPSVADVDGDGRGEILVGGCKSPSFLGLHVLGSADGDWPRARPVYNQHTYWGGNIEDDLSVPTDTTPSWLRDENVLRGQPHVWFTPAQPDLHAAVSSVCVASCDPDGYAEVAVQVWNSGEAEASAGTSVRLYGTPEGTPTLLDERLLDEPLAPQSSLEWSVPASREALGSELWAVADEPNTVEECNEDNNLGSLPFTSCE